MHICAQDLAPFAARNWHVVAGFKHHPLSLLVCTDLQSEVAVHCIGFMAEARTHASSGNMKPGPCVMSADGAHNSCPQVLHSQVSVRSQTLLPLVVGTESWQSSLCWRTHTRETADQSTNYTDVI